MNEAVNQRLHRAKLVSSWISQRTDGLPMSTEQRRLLSAACMHQAMEHQDGIIHLVDVRVYGSAVTLVRPLFEAYVRGAWLYHCATDRQIAQMPTQGNEPDATKMIPKLEGTEVFSGGILKKILRQSWPAMNQFTHTNWAQIIRRLSESAVEPRYSPEELISTLDFATAIALLATGHLASLRDDPKLAADCLGKIREVAADSKPHTSAE